jgi:hypothetical protein
MPTYFYLSHQGVTHRLIVPNDVADPGERFKQFAEQILGVDQLGKTPGCYVSSLFIPELSALEKTLHGRYGNLENVHDA